MSTISQVVHPFQASLAPNVRPESLLEGSTRKLVYLGRLRSNFTLSRKGLTNNQPIAPIRKVQRKMQLQVAACMPCTHQSSKKQEADLLLQCISGLYNKSFMIVIYNCNVATTITLRSQLRPDLGRIINYELHSVEA